MSTVTSWNASAFQSKYWKDYDWKDITQLTVKTLMADTDLSVFGTQESVVNGVKQYLFIGTPELKDFTPKITIADFNSDQVDMKQFYIHFDHQKKVTVIVPNDVLSLDQSFTSRQQAVAFKQYVIDKLSEAIKVHMFHRRMRTLIKGKIEKKDTGSDAEKYETFNFDKDVRLGAFTTKDEIESGLIKMRKILTSFKTPSTQHTLFSKDSNNKNFYASFLPKEFKMIWNNDFHGNILRYYGGKFNDDDALLKVAKQIVHDFSLIEDAGDTSKMIGFLVHESGLKEIIPVKRINNQLRVPNFQMLYEALVQYGHGRLTPFPIVRFTTTALSSRKKRSAPVQDESQ